jgi:hypothetical protein
MTVRRSAKKASQSRSDRPRKIGQALGYRNFDLPGELVLMIVKQWRCTARPTESPLPQSIP